MKITLRKITNTPLDFNIESNKITFKGYLQYDSNKLILLKAKLNGFVDTECSQCAEFLQVPINEDIKIFISDGIYEDSNKLDIDVIESFDSNADLDEILNSEIELIKSDYHSCKNCK